MTLISILNATKQLVQVLDSTKALLTQIIQQMQDERFAELETVGKGPLIPCIDDLLTAKEAESELNISRSTLYRLRMAKLVVTLKQGGRLLFRREDILAAVQAYSIPKGKI